MPLLLLLLLTVSPAAAQTSQASLRVLSGAPNGEIATLAEANEIRVVFSEPMVTAGRIPARVVAPFFRVTPAIPGTFRWSGTTILIFTPDPKRPLPYATKYDVAIEPPPRSAAVASPSHTGSASLHRPYGS